MERSLYTERPLYCANDEAEIIIFIINTTYRQKEKKTGMSKGPYKRSQHCWPTRRNIVGPNLLRAFEDHVVCCCDLLDEV